MRAIRACFVVLGFKSTPMRARRILGQIERGADPTLRTQQGLCAFELALGCPSFREFTWGSSRQARTPPSSERFLKHRNHSCHSCQSGFLGDAWKPVSQSP